MGDFRYREKSRRSAIRVWEFKPIVLVEQGVRQYNGVKALRLARNGSVVAQPAGVGGVRHDQQRMAKHGFSDIIRMINQTIGEITTNNDPYFELKKESNQLALNLYPQLREIVARASDPLRLFGC